LVDLVDSVLVDPNLHTDTRMRLHREIGELLRAKHGDHLPALLHSVLVDPNLHTDLRMRLHREISEMVRGAREHGAAVHD
jgi:hypothetical protein